MATTDPTGQMIAVRDGWDRAIPSAIPSGINGDPAHYDSPGKHISRADNIRLFGPNAWCVTLAQDKAGPADKACAWDMNMNRADQNTVHNRFITVYNNRSTDPRAKYIHAFNGWNGIGLPMRYNLRNGATAVTDNSHTWHEHVETHYGYVNDPMMTDAVLSVIRGETMAGYIGRTVITMASIWDEQIGQDTGLPGRTFRNMSGDVQNLRNWLGVKTGTSGLPWVPEAGSPLRALELLPQIARQSQDTAAEIGQLKAAVATLTALVESIVPPSIP